MYLNYDGFIGGSVAPWERCPREPVSWWSMLQFSGSAFFFAGVALRQIKSDCLLGSIPGTGKERMFAVRRPMGEYERIHAIEHLDNIETQFRSIGLQITAVMTKGIADKLRERRDDTFEWLIDQVTVIEDLANTEFKKSMFFYVPSERFKFLPLHSRPHLFGDKVADAFPSVSYEIDEAGMCLGLARPTASVFHLMRVLEAGLSALGKVFGVSLAHTNWAPAIEEIESKIRNMHKDPVWKALSDYKERQEFYAQAAAHFAILKDAIRNSTMHVRSKFTEEQAEQIFESTKAFMQKLAERLSE
jgi:hypothetical protein